MPFYDVWYLPLTLSLGNHTLNPLLLIQVDITLLESFLSTYAKEPCTSDVLSKYLL